MSLQSVFIVLGGLGLFLFGMKMMSEGLQRIAGDSMRSILEKATKNKFIGILVGIIVTICFNSSTATTVMTVGFVNSGLLNLRQAILIILGANVGTTLSAQLIAFKIDSFAPLFIFIGIIMYMFLKKRSIKNIGYIVLGFGILFFGITTMGAPMKEFASQPSFIAMLTAFENPLLALLAGFAFTAVVQSSTATTGILVTMHLNGVPIPFETSAFILLGVNLGTSLTSLIASIPANRDSKRAALFHIMFDVFGSAIFGTLIFIFPAILNWFQVTWVDTARQVAMFHTLYNIATLILLIPFTKHVAKLMEKLIPLKTSETRNSYEKKLIYLDIPQTSTPLSVINAHLEMVRMKKIANENFALALEGFFEKNVEKANKVLENEKIINFLNHNIASKLVSINKKALPKADALKVGRMFTSLTDIERIGDHAEHIAKYTLEIIENNLKFSDIALEELKELGSLTLTLLNDSLDVYEHHDETKLTIIDETEKEIDKLAVEFTENHIKRLKKEHCEPKSGVIFTDMIIDLERSADHSKGVARSVSKKPYKTNSNGNGKN